LLAASDDPAPEVRFESPGNLGFASPIRGDLVLDKVALRFIRVMECAAGRVLHRVERIEVAAGSGEVDVRVQGDRLTFRALGVDFVPDDFLDRPRFANVVTLRSYDATDIASLVPKGVVDLDRLLANGGRPGRLRTSSEGLTILTDGEELISCAFCGAYTSSRSG
jgi:hypothetical protein